VTGTFFEKKVTEKKVTGTFFVSEKVQNCPFYVGAQFIEPADNCVSHEIGSAVFPKGKGTLDFIGGLQPTGRSPFRLTESAL